MPEDPAAEPALQHPPASYPIYKFEKAIYDYQRVHAHMLGACHDHRSFDGHRVGLQQLRFAIDDVLADLVATWDAIQTQVFERAGANGKNVKQRLEGLSKSDVRAHDQLQLAWTNCFRNLNDARNFKQHEGFWPPNFGIGQAGSPFAIDLIWPGIGIAPGMYLMREARYGLAHLSWLDDALGLGHGFAAQAYGCGACFDDGRIQDEASWLT